MARARLHLICGNCGCNSMWKYRIDPQGHDIDGQLCPAVFLICGNCHTLHDIADYATEQPSLPVMPASALDAPGSGI